MYNKVIPIFMAFFVFITLASCNKLFKPGQTGVSIVETNCTRTINDPILTIISRNYRRYDQVSRYENDLTGVLINLGLKVVRAPDVREVEKQIGNAELLNRKAGISDNKTAAQKGQQSSNQQLVTEKYMVYGETNADYILEADITNRSIKIINKNSNEVLAVLNNVSRPSTHKDNIYNVFRSLCFNVKRSAY